MIHKTFTSIFEMADIKFEEIVILRRILNLRRRMRMNGR